MKIIRVENRNQPLAAPLQAVYCDSFLCRLIGLMFRSSLPQDTGLLLVEAHDSRFTTTIHMLFVHMYLAVIWINSMNKVVDTILARSWHPAYTPRQAARYILEIHPSRLDEFRIGDQIEFQHA
jgi:uncharacterized membrane protein (UPF0127 family)